MRIGLAAFLVLAGAILPVPSWADPMPGPAATAKYVLPDGTILIAGNDLMLPYLQGLLAMFREQHPQFRFHLEMHTSGLSVAGISAGKSAIGPIARDVTLQEREAFRSRHGYDLTDIQVGWDNSPDPAHQPPGKYPPGVWVNVRNPTPWLTLEQVAGIFTTGTGHGDYTFWGQLQGHEGPVGANGADYAKRQIHVYLPKLERLPILATLRETLGSGPWSDRVEYLPMMEDVINAVANDPFGIGLIGWWPTDEGWDRAADLAGKVRLMPLARDDSSRPSRGGPGDVYPLAGGLRFVIDKAPGRPLEPWIKAFLELALSSQGQDLLAGMTRTDGFVPLEPGLLSAQRAKLE